LETLERPSSAAERRASAAQQAFVVPTVTAKIDDLPGITNSRESHEKSVIVCRFESSECARNSTMIRTPAVIRGSGSVSPVEKIGQNTNLTHRKGLLIPN
jgi:hypothetical protein